MADQDTSVGSIFIGRRVATEDDIEKAGDYCLSLVTVQGHDVPQVWFLLPLHEGKERTEIGPDGEPYTISGVYDHPTEGSGLHGVSSPPWTFRECEDGSVEVRASILSGKTDERPEGYWHGYLDCGHQWRRVG